MSRNTCELSLTVAPVSRTIGKAASATTKPPISPITPIRNNLGKSRGNLPIHSTLQTTQPPRRRFGGFLSSEGFDTRHHLYWTSSRGFAAKAIPKRRLRAASLIMLTAGGVVGGFPRKELLRPGKHWAAVETRSCRVALCLALTRNPTPVSTVIH
jgi:hypothetical protein